MKKTHLYALVVGIAALVAVAAWILVDRDELQRFRVGIPSKIEGVYPWNGRGPLTIRVLSQVYEPIIGVDPNGHLTPALAKSWKSDDDRVWTIRLRDERPIHGDAFEQLSAQDVKGALERLIRPDSYNSFVLNGVIAGTKTFFEGESGEVSGIRVIDEGTIEITLDTPRASFPYRLAFAGLLMFKPNDDESRPRGTGPFSIQSVKDTGQIVMSRFQAYPAQTDRAGLVNEVSFEPVSDSALRAQAVARGELDLAIVDRRGYGSLGEAPEGVMIEEWLPYNVHFVGFNNSTLSAVELRRAISLALDRKTIRDKIMDGGAVISTGFIPPNMAAGAIPELPEADRITIEQLVEASGYDGRELTMVVHQQANSEEIGSYLRSRMSEFGVEIGLETVDTQTALTRMVRGEGDLFSLFFDYSYAHPGLILDAFMPSNIPVPNFWRYEPAGASILPQIERLRKASPRDEALRNLEADIVAEAPAAFLFAQPQYVIIREGFEGLGLSPVNQLNISGLYRP